MNDSEIECLKSELEHEKTCRSVKVAYFGVN